jgi:tryptophan halogenase
MNIVIVGGGTAGWLSAYIISKIQPKLHKITVIESSSIGIIGAGEVSTGLMHDLLSGKYFPSGTDLQTFIDNTDSTRKMGIKHVNWKGDGTSYFAPVDGSPSQNYSPDYIFNYVFSKYGKEKIHLASPIGQAYDLGMDIPYGGALQFDGNKVGAYLKKLSLNEYVKTIDSVVKDVKISSNGTIESVVLDNDQEVFGDFFIDCTGFARVLIKKLGLKWKHYGKHLPVDRALPFILQYEDGQKIESITTAHAMDYGWMWNVPLQSRIGAGYVFSSSHTDETKAQEEVEKLLGKPIKPIKLIKFDSGRSEELWKSNCLAVGLSGAFSEPLEATSIHGTVLQLLVFSSHYLVSDIETTNNEINRKTYNNKIGKLYDDYCDFLVIHYQGGRADTDFWRYVTSKEAQTEFTSDILETCKYRIPTTLDYEQYVGASAPLWAWTLAGLDIINKDQAKTQLQKLNLYEKSREMYEEFSTNIKADLTRNRGL